LALLDRITGNPYITVNGAARDLEVAFTTAQRTIEALVSHRILKQTNDSRRDRVYCAQDLLDILDEPADVIQAEKTNAKKRQRRQR